MTSDIQNLEIIQPKLCDISHVKPAGAWRAFHLQAVLMIFYRNIRLTLRCECHGHQQGSY